MLFSHPIEQYWFFRYKVYHLLFWALYFFAWGVVELSLPIAFEAMFFSPRFLIFLFYVFIHTFAVYFNLYVLLPKYLYKGKLTQYILFLAMWIIITSVIMLGCYFLSAHLIGEPLDYFCVFDAEKNETYFHILSSEILPATSGTILLGLCIKLSKNSLLAQKRQQILENEKLTTELNFLKHQFNPHFLFNTINSIFFLIHKAPEQASNALAKFSDLLRYQLYECNEQQIPLDQEITYLENFIALEKLRRNQDLKVDLHIHITNKVPLGIAPFVLVTFVENAFKHVSTNKDMSNWIEIKIQLDKDQFLHFEVANSQATDDVCLKQDSSYGGIGLQNVQRRLDLVYPGNYNLSIKDRHTLFKIDLRLQLSELTIVEELLHHKKIVS
ncbi:sensor histidine kinase [Aquimarina sp. M1]